MAAMPKVHSAPSSTSGSDSSRQRAGKAMKRMTTISTTAMAPVRASPEKMADVMSEINLGLPATMAPDANGLSSTASWMKAAA